MISYIEGTIISISERFTVVSVGGVGYKIFTTKQTCSNLTKNEVVSFHTFLSVRETALDLYGFRTENELEYFELLNTVSGIGPKTAIGILDIAEPKTLEMAIVSGNTEHLTQVSGIGKKNAEKIVRELSGKTPSLQLNGEATYGRSEDLDTIAALVSLGYSEKSSREALQNVPKDILKTEEKIKYALKNLN